MQQAIIIEDEPVAARRLGRMLQKQGIETMASLSSVAASVEWFQQNPPPPLIFLDIQLGDGVSFEIFEQVSIKSPIIFTTAYDQYALRAFELNSIDYLLKPIAEKDLQKALAKWKEMQPLAPTVDSDFIKQWRQYAAEGVVYKQRFLVNKGQVYKTVATQEVSYFLSEFKTSFLFTPEAKYEISESLTELENVLPPNEFFRINRQCIVNIQSITQIKAYSGHRLAIEMQGSDEVFLVSRERVSDFKEWLAK